MKMSLLTFAVVSIVAPFSMANDGGVAAIKVNEIRMREYKYENYKEKEVRRISKPNFKITFSGGEAAKLQKILPSTVSVLTAMQPELKKAYEESFKTLGIYSEASNGVTSKVISISCSDADLVSAGNDKMKIVKKGQSSCEISIVGAEGDGASDYFGDMQEFVPACKQ